MEQLTEAGWLPVELSTLEQLTHAERDMLDAVRHSAMNCVDMRHMGSSPGAQLAAPASFPKLTWGMPDGRLVSAPGQVAPPCSGVSSLRMALEEAGALIKAFNVHGPYTHGLAELSQAERGMLEAVGYTGAAVGGHPRLDSFPGRQGSADVTQELAARLLSAPGQVEPPTRCSCLFPCACKPQLPSLTPNVRWGVRHLA